MGDQQTSHPKAFSIRCGRFVPVGVLPPTAEDPNNSSTGDGTGSKGQNDNKSTKGKRPRKADKSDAEAASRKKPAARKSVPSATSARAVTVSHLIKAGLIEAGSTVHVTHRTESDEGTLQEDGSVMCGDTKYGTCGEFSTAVKYRLQPNSRADDGWRSCTVNGRSLHDYRTELLED